MDRANEWLQTNVGICQVKTCETVTWSAVNPQSLGDSEQMALSTSIAPASKTFHLRGFRSELLRSERLERRTLQLSIESVSVALYK